MSFIHERVVMFRFNISFIDKRHLMTKFYGGIIFFSVKLRLLGDHDHHLFCTIPNCELLEIGIPHRQFWLYKKWKHQVAENFVWYKTDS